MKTYNIAILGATGAVGQETMNILAESDFPLNKLRLLASKRSVGKTFQYKDQMIVCEEATLDSFEDRDISLNTIDNGIVSNPQIDCVVEVMNGIHPAYEFISAALKNKKHVVSANKAVVAAHIKEFTALANENGVRFLFEGSTGGGIPWIANLNKAKRIDDIHHFHGIFNGTGNYILDEMTHQEKDFDVVLKKAQELGYAETDPSADIDGYDVQNKVVISSAVAFNAFVDMNEFLCYGIRNITKTDIEYFKNLEFTIKYIGEATMNQNYYEAFVMPNLFKQSAAEANINSNFNIATLTGQSIGPSKFYGQGAGKLPTANAVVQDLIDIEHPHTAYNLDFSNQLTYKAVQKNTFIIRTNTKIEDVSINKVEEVASNYYLHTKEINADELRELVAKSDDKSMFVAKVAKFEE